MGAKVDNSKVDNTRSIIELPKGSSNANLTLKIQDRSQLPLNLNIQVVAEKEEELIVIAKETSVENIKFGDGVKQKLA